MAYRPAVGALFGAAKKRWPTVRTLAVLNWPVSPSLAVDIWVVQYELLERLEFRRAKAAMQAAGREVRGYHCVSPTPPSFLNTFVDVPLVKSRLIPWLSASYGLDGWLYWYTNWGSRHAPSARDPETGRLRPLGPPALDGATGYDPTVAASPAGLADGHFTNEDGNLVYAGDDGPRSSLRLEVMRLGFEDLALLRLLGRERAAEIASSLVGSASNFSISPAALEDRGGYGPLRA